jgi:nucleoside-diphosphate-sugar epimerase
MKVFLTGGTGFVGSWTVPALRKAGFGVRLLVRDPAKAERVLASRGLASTDVEIVRGDMLDRLLVEQAALGCSATIHCAAAIGLTSESRGTVFQQNVDGARNVVDAALRAGHDPVVDVSSVTIFLPPREAVLTASAPISAPLGEYGRSKVETERELRRLQDGGRPITIVYPGGVVGPGAPSIDATVGALVGGRKQGWPVTTGGTCILDVRDLATALVATLEPRRGPRRYMLGGHFFGWGQLCDVLDELTGVRAKRIRVPRTMILAVGAAFDLVRRIRPVAHPLSYEGATIMTSMVPTNDEPTLRELGVTLRPARETLEDTFRWLVAEKHLRPALAPRLGG